MLSSNTPAPAHRTAAENSARSPLCFVVDSDSSIRSFLSLVLHGVGVDTEEFVHGKSVEAGLSTREPSLVFLNIALESSEAIETVIALGRRGYSGHIQLMSTGAPRFWHTLKVSASNIGCRCFRSSRSRSRPTPLSKSCKSLSSVILRRSPDAST